MSVGRDSAVSGTVLFGVGEGCGAMSLEVEEPAESDLYLHSSPVVVEGIPDMVVLF